MILPGKNILFKTRFVFLLFFALALFTVVLYILSMRLVNNKINIIHTLNQKLEEERKIYKKLLSSLYNLPSQKELESIKFIYLPIEKSIEFIDELENVYAQKLDVTVSSLASNSLKNSNLLLLKMSVSAKGDINSILKFMKLLENLPYLSNLERVRVEKINNENWQFFADLNVYALSDNKEDAYEKNK